MATLEAIRERVLRARAHAAVRHEDEIVRELDEALAEIERLQDDVGIRELRASSRLHAQLDAELGPLVPLTNDEMRILADSRPGKLPWKKADANDHQTEWRTVCGFAKYARFPSEGV